jgi:taurine transport system substrate-binding protein
MQMKKVLGLVLALAMVMSLLVSCGGNSSDEKKEEEAGGAPEQIVIGTQGLMNLETYAQLEKMIEEKMGDVTVEWKQFNAGKDLNQAFAAGEIDFGVLGASPVAVALAQDIDYKVIYSTAMLTNTEAMVATPASGIKSVKDLEGKTVACTFTSTCHYTLLSAMEHEGVDASKVKIIDMEPDKIVAAWKRGDIDAAYTWNPALGQLKAEGGKLVITSGEVGEMGYPVADFAVVRTEFADQYPDYVKKYLEALVDAEAVYAETPEKVYEAFADHFEGYTAKTVKEAMTDDYYTGKEQVEKYFDTDEYTKLVVKISEFLADQEQIDKALDEEFVAEHVDGSFLSEVAK